MSKISKEQILKLAKLSQLSLTEEEISQYQEDLSSILSYVERLEKVDTEGLKPTYQVSGKRNVMRADIVKKQAALPDELLASAPRTEGRYIKVGRMI